MPNRRPGITRFSNIERKHLLKEGRLIHRQDAFDIRYSPSPKDFGRILVITPRRVGSAPERNLIRRRLVELFYQDEWYKKKVDIVVFCRKNSTDLSYQQLKLIFNAIFSSIPTG